MSTASATGLARVDGELAAVSVQDYRATVQGEPQFVECLRNTG